MNDMKLHRYPMFVLFLLFSLFMASHVVAAENPLSWAPADSEFIASVNIRQIADSALTQRILREKGGEKFDAILQVLKGLTGMDLLKDLDRAAIWGRIDDNDSVVLLFQGRYNQETLTTLLKVNPKYQATQRSGITMHEWFDEKEKRMKYGAFLPDGSVVICNQPQGLDAVIGAHADASRGFLGTPKAKQIPSDSDSQAAWAMILRPNRALPNGKFKDTLQAESALATLTLKPEIVTVSLNVKTTTSEAAQGWLDMAKGLIALGRLQQDNTGFRKLSEVSQVSPASDGKGIALEIRLTDQDFMGLLNIPGDKGSPAPATTKKTQ